MSIINNLADTYEIKEKLEEGMEGIVYKAYHRRLCQDVVIKLYKRGSRSLAGDRREADILKNLRHSYLPQVLDFFETEDEVCTVISCVQGETFAQLLQEGCRFTPGELIRWGMQICSALNYLHSQEPPVIHCNVKPANIILTRKGDICLIDFNISFYLGDTGAPGYTDGYTSPEQYLAALGGKIRQDSCGVRIDGRTDIYSAGATLYHLVMGEKAGDYRERIDTDALAQAAGEAFAQVIERAMRIDPEQRFQSVFDMFCALQNLPKKDRRYVRLLHRQTGVRIGLTICLAGFILLGGFGIGRMKQERVDVYNGLVEEQSRLIEEGRFEEEEEVFEEASALLPSSPESYYQNAYALYSQEKYEDCISFIDYDVDQNKRLNSAQMRMADIYYLRADSYFRLGRYKEAVKAYKDVFRLGTEHPEYYRDYAVALASSGDAREAQSVLQEAVDFGLKADSVSYAKGEIEHVLGRPDAAIQEFLQCIDMTDDREMKARAYLMVSRIYGEKGSDATQRDVLLQAREELPVEDQIQILESLAAVDIGLADTTGKKEYRREAAEVLTQITEQGWGTFDTLDTLAIQYEKLGEINQAKKTADRMLADYGEDYRIYMRYAFLEIDVQQRKENSERDYTLFAEYCEKAEALYAEQVRDNNTDAQMQLLQEQYIQIEEGGWID